jgi:putative nucleotidyltransferase with HDIG domain
MAHHLRSSFGRRILLLFALCILAPGAIFGYLSLRQVDDKFHQESLRRMRLQSRGIVMAIHGGFSSIETEVEFVAGILGNETDPLVRRSSDWNWLFHDRPLLGATRLRGGSRVEVLFGNPCPPPPRTDAAKRHIANNLGLIYRQTGGGTSTRFFLAHAIRGKAPDREILICEVNPVLLWGLVRDAVPPLTEVAILSPVGELLFQTKPLPDAVLRRIVEDRRKGPDGNFEYGEKTGTLLVDFATLFMRPAFLADDLVVVVSQPRSEAFAAAKQFTQVLFLSIVLFVLVVGLFAQVQIRRSVAPLAVLKEGTRRISGGDFNSRVEIRSGDEFEDLAGSFNTMADHLGREFRIQADMGRVVQAVLSETRRGRIVETVLENVNSVVPCDCAVVALLHPDVAGDAAITYIREDTSVVPSATRKGILHLSGDEIRRMKSAEKSVIVGKSDEFPDILSGWTGRRPSGFLLSPFVSREELVGILVLGYTNPAEPTSETMIRLRQIADQTNIALSRARLLEELVQNDLGTLTALARTVDTNSPWTAGHSERVTLLAMDIARELGLSDSDIDSLRRGGLLHDIGKIGVPPSILDKPGKLTEEEFAIVRRHPTKGAEILEPIRTFQTIIPMVAQHHERFDGKGYPMSLSGEAISLHARILAVADVVDALVSDRPYRVGWSREKVLLYTRENSGSQFDPSVVEAFLRVEARRGVDASPEPELTVA